MRPSRLTFVSHAIICIAVAAGSYLAYRAGALTAVWENDMSMMTSVIAGLFVLTAVVLGREAWRADDPTSSLDGKRWNGTAWVGPPTNADFGHLAMLLSPALGMLGTVVGFSLQAKALIGGSAGFGPLATGLYSTGCGVAAFVVLAVMVFNLESGMRRGGR